MTSINVNEINAFTDTLINITEKNRYNKIKDVENSKVIKWVFDKLNVYFEVIKKSEGIYQISTNKYLENGLKLYIYYSYDFWFQNTNRELSIMGSNNIYYVFFDSNEAKLFLNNFNKFVSNKNKNRKYGYDLSKLSQENFGISLLDIVDPVYFDIIFTIKSLIHLMSTNYETNTRKPKLKSTSLLGHKESRKREKFNKRRKLAIKRSNMIKNLKFIKESPKIYSMGLNSIYYLNSIDVEMLLEVFDADKNLFVNYYTLRRMVRIIKDFDKVFQRYSHKRMKEYSVGFLTRKTSRYDRLEVKGWVFLGNFRNSLKVIDINLLPPLHFGSNEKPNKEDYKTRKILNDKGHYKFWRILLSASLKKGNDVIIDLLRYNKYSKRYIDYLESLNLFKKVDLDPKWEFHDVQTQIHKERNFCLYIDKKRAKKKANANLTKEYPLSDFFEEPSIQLQVKRDIILYILIDNSIINHPEPNSYLKGKILSPGVNKVCNEIINDVNKEFSGPVNFLLVYKNINEYFIYPFYIYKDLIFGKEWLELRFMNYRRGRESDSPWNEIDKIMERKYQLFLKYIYKNNIFKQKMFSIEGMFMNGLRIEFDYELIEKRSIMSSPFEKFELPQKINIYYTKKKKRKRNREDFRVYNITNRLIKLVLNEAIIFNGKKFYHLAVKKITTYKYCSYGYYNAMFLYDIRNKDIITTRTYKNRKYFVSEMDRKLYKRNSPDIYEIPYVRSIGTKTQDGYKGRGFASLLLTMFEDKFKRDNIFWISLYALPKAAGFWLKKQNYTPLKFDVLTFLEGEMLKNLFDPNLPLYNPWRDPRSITSNVNKILFEFEVLKRHIES